MSDAGAGAVEAADRGGEPRRLLALGLALMALSATRIGPRTVEAIGLLWRQVLGIWGPSAWPPPMGLAMTDALFELARIGWPALLGLAIARSRRPTVARAVSLTSIILAAESITTASAGFRSAPTLAVWGASALLIIRSAFEAGLGVFSWRVADKSRMRARAAGEGPASPRAVASRMAVVATITFAVCVFGLRTWDGFVSLVSSDARIRRLILIADRETRPVRPYVESPENRSIREIEYALRSADDHAARGRYQNAIKDYRHALFLGDQVRSRGRVENPTGFEYQAALIRNNLAWVLVTCPDQALRDAAQAEALARKVVNTSPREGTYWNTLGLVLYRVEKLKEASDAIEKSMRFRDGGDNYDWYILAMIRLREGRHQDARGLYERAEEQTRTIADAKADLVVLRTEAAAALGLGEPPPIVPDPNVPGRRRLGRVVPPGVATPTASQP